MHKYVITDSIREQNVLRFMVEYIGRFNKTGNNAIDIDVEAIDTAEVIDSPARMEMIVDYIISYHNKKTHSKEYTAMFAVSSIRNLISYYELLKKKKDAGEHNLRVAAIFTYGANEEDQDASGLLPDNDQVLEDLPMVAEGQVEYITSHSRVNLDEIIADYNAMYNTAFSTRDSRQFENYFKDISKRINDR